MKDRKQAPFTDPNSAPFVVAMESAPRVNELAKAYHAGDSCPRCHAGQLDYDGLLNLSCPVCGYAIGGCFT